MTDDQLAEAMSAAIRRSPSEPLLPRVTKTGLGYLRRFAEHTVHVYREPLRPGNGVSAPALDRLRRDGLVSLG